MSQKRDQSAINRKSTRDFAARTLQRAPTWVLTPIPINAEGAEKAAAEATTAEATTVRSILLDLKMSAKIRKE